MAVNPNACRKKMEKVLVILVEAGRVNSSNCHDILQQYSSFIEDANVNQLCEEFDPCSDLVDRFFNNHLAKNKEYETLRTIVSQLLLIYYGQAAVERSFSVNKYVSVVNL